MIGYVLKRLGKYINLTLFMVSLSVLFLLKSYSHISTSLVTLLPDTESKELIKRFNVSQHNKVLFVAVKGLHKEALHEMKALEKSLTQLPLVSLKKRQSTHKLYKHQQAYKLFIHPLNTTQMSHLNAADELQKLYKEMTTSFFPVTIDKIDPFQLLGEPEPIDVKLKNGHLILGKYGYLSYFVLHSQTLEEHQKVYADIQHIMQDKTDIQYFSPIFYYVENSKAIRSDVNKIIMIAFSILVLLYLILLRDFLLLLHTFTTLATSAIIATLILTQIYEEVSIFVFVFGISISTVAIDYMFHHYLHGYYSQVKGFNKEVLFGVLTTLSVFIILSFTSFTLIRQISLFAIISLLISYLHFAFLYPHLGFKALSSSQSIFRKDLRFVNAKILLLCSLILLSSSLLWLRFDFNLKNLDYNNQRLKQTENFFYEHLNENKKMTFAIKAKNIDALIANSQKIQHHFPSAHIPIAALVSQVSYKKNKDTISSFRHIRDTLQVEAAKLGFTKGYFEKAYDMEKPLLHYTEDAIKAYGIDIIKINTFYTTYGIVNQDVYAQVLQYGFVESLSVKERFESSMEVSIVGLIKLGVFALFIIMILLYFITKRAIVYALMFLIFPIAMVSLYALFSAINILHIFMLFVILAIGIDYAIYLSKENDVLTQRAIGYSLISTFAGFGVLVFSQINALYSLGVIATIGVVSIFMLLLFMKGTENVS